MITEFIRILIVYIYTQMYIVDSGETSYHFFFLCTSVALCNELSEVYERISRLQHTHLPHQLG